MKYDLVVVGAGPSAIFLGYELIKLNSKKKVLIAGIGDSQETFSYLAVIKSLVKDKPLKDVVDLQIVDLQSKPMIKDLQRNAFFEYLSAPDFASDSFVKVKDDSKMYNVYRYRVNDEILDFVADTYENAEKSKWECRLQDALPEYPAEDFDVISINNTLGYIKNDDERYSAIQNVLRKLKMDGTFVTDPFRDFWLKKAGVIDSFREVRANRIGAAGSIVDGETGIYKKVSNVINPPAEEI